MARAGCFSALHLLLFLVSSAWGATLNETCPALRSSYNATGSVQVAYHTTDNNPAFVPENQLLPPSTNFGLLADRLIYTLTVGTIGSNASNDGEVLSTIFVDVPPAINLFNDNSSTGFAACAIPILNLPSLTTRYGQEDDGACFFALPDGCGTGIAGAVIRTEFNTVPDDRNFQRFCTSVADQFQQMLFEEGPSSNQLSNQCADLFRDPPGGPVVSYVSGHAITSNGSNTTWPFVSSGCNDTEGFLKGDSSYPWFNHSIPLNDANYDKATRAVYPIVTIFFQNINTGFAKSKIEPRSVSLACLRANDFMTGSRVSPELEPVKTSNGGRSSHDITVAIVVSVIAGVLFVLMVIGWLWLLRRRSRGGVKRNPFAHAVDQVFGKPRPR